MKIDMAVVEIYKLQEDNAVYKANANEDKATLASLEEAVKTAKN